MTGENLISEADATNSAIAVRHRAGAAETRPHRGQDKPLIQSLVRADTILSAIADAGPGGLGLMEIAASAGLNKSTAHHLLRTLIALGFVEQSDTTRNYQIGLRSFQLVWQSHRLRELSAEYHNVMMRLCHQTGETVNLSVPYGDGALVVSSLEGRGVVRAATYTGALWALHATACGKVILANLKPAQQESFLTARRRRYTENTITGPEALRTEIESVVRQGYAVEVEEHEIGAACVAVPVFSRRRTFSGAISIAAPMSRMDDARRRDLARLMSGEIANARPPSRETIGQGTKQPKSSSNKGEE